MTISVAPAGAFGFLIGHDYPGLETLGYSLTPSREGFGRRRAQCGGGLGLRIAHAPGTRRLRGFCDLDSGPVIRSLAGRVSVVVIEHDVDLVMSISDRVIVLHQGRKLFEGTPAEVRASSAVRDAYLGAEHGAA